MSEPSTKEKQYPRDSEKTRARILQAATELFSNSSYSMVRSRDIARLASVDVALINRYFGSKKELFTAVLDQLASNRVELSSDDLEKSLSEDFLLRLRGERHHRTSAAIRVLALSASDPEVAPILQERMASELEKLAQKLPDNDRTTAAALIAYIIGTHTLLQMLPQDSHDALRGEELLAPMQAIIHHKKDM